MTTFLYWRSIFITGRILSVLTLREVANNNKGLDDNAVKLSIVGASHARDEEAKTKHCSQNIAGMAPLLLWAVTLRPGNDRVRVMRVALT